VEKFFAFFHGSSLGVTESVNNAVSLVCSDPITPSSDFWGFSFPISRVPRYGPFWKSQKPHCPPVLPPDDFKLCIYSTVDRLHSQDKISYCFFITRRIVVTSISRTRKSFRRYECSLNYGDDHHHSKYHGGTLSHAGPRWPFIKGTFDNNEWLANCFYHTNRSGSL
jgi:hypothetical protein